MIHSFYIPVLGLAYSIDTPLKVARYGISSTISIVDDILIEDMRRFHCERSGRSYEFIDPKTHDSRAKRITAYLNLLEELVNDQFRDICNQPFEPGYDICRYFELLSDENYLKKEYNNMLLCKDTSLKTALQTELRSQMQKGSIDVNIMTKVDKINPVQNGADNQIYSDAMASLRGFAMSNLSSSIILSAGINSKLYSYLEKFSDFNPDSAGKLKKKVILKVSDYRSALIQGKFLAKKGIFVSEFRVESGLNCGGHGFATDGYLIGPILEEFKNKRQEINSELFDIYSSSLLNKGYEKPAFHNIRITAQGGIGSHYEDHFISSYYQLDATGWGSPFLLTPEVTNVDEETLKLISNAKTEDFYISSASPLGVPFNNFRKANIETVRLERIQKGKPGSPCPKKYLVSNTEFTQEPICTASHKYQKLKIEQLKSMNMSDNEFMDAFNKITEKICLCVGLAASAYMKNNISNSKNIKEGVSICPGPNTAYFSGIFSLDDMIKHIYGKINLLETSKRSHMFINELRLYVDYLRKDIDEHIKAMNEKKDKYFTLFKEKLLKGVEYYQSLIPKIKLETEVYRQKMEEELSDLKYKIQHIKWTIVA